MKAIMKNVCKCLLFTQTTEKTIASEPWDWHFGKVLEISCYLHMKTTRFLNSKWQCLPVNEVRNPAICLRGSTV